jgi:potassium/hydrogen antiporter
MGAFQILTSLSILLLVGILITYVSRRLRIPNVLGLIIAGIVIAPVRFEGMRIFNFSGEFLTAVAILALIMIVFDSTMRLPISKISADTYVAFKITGMFLVFEMAVFSVATHYIAGFPWFFAILFSSILVGTDPSAILSMFGNLKHKLITLLQVESIVNTPLTVVVPFVVIELAKTFNVSTLFSYFIEQISPFLQQIITGIGAGVVVALLTFRTMHKYYSELLSPVALISSALLTYILAEGLGGNGVLAVTTLGLFFGNMSLKRKHSLRTVGSLLSNLFEILVFLLLGVSITLPTQWSFYIAGLMLFVVYLALRFIVVELVFFKGTLSNKEKLFFSLNSAKGVAVGVVAFSLLSLGVKATPVIQMSMLFIIYSVVLSTILARMSKYFLGIVPERK